MTLLSPGVEIKEIDASTIIPTVSDSVAVFCGNFMKGPVNEKVLITNPDDLVEIFGKPTDETYPEFQQAYNFLQYGDTIYIVRLGDETSSGQILQNQGVDQANAPKGVLIENSEQFESLRPALGQTKVQFYQSSPGSWGNDIEIAIQNPEDFNLGKLAFKDMYLDSLFEYYPEKTGVNGVEEEGLNEVQVAIKIGDSIESFLVSLDEDGKNSNSQNIFIENIINRMSEFVYVAYTKGQQLDSRLYKPTQDEIDNYDGQDENGNALPHPNLNEDGVLELQEGEDNLGGQAELLTAFELFDNVEEVSVDIIIGNEIDDGRSQINLANSRKDCIAFYGANNQKANMVGQKAAKAVQNIVDWRKSPSFNHNTMFACLQGNYKYQYDRYNDKNRWVNLQGDIQGLRAQTNTTNASWWASQGLDRGQIKNVLKLAFVPNMPQRDLLYKNSINPVTTFPGMGTVMWGQKTLQTKPSQFDRVNVRALFNTVERSLAEMSRYQVFEFNDEYTRNRIVQMIRPFLETVQAGRGIQDFLVVCDTSNNTPDIISRNQLIVDVYIKPTYAQEYITLRFHNQGVNDFSTLVS